MVLQDSTLNTNNKARKEKAVRAQARKIAAYNAGHELMKQENAQMEQRIHALRNEIEIRDAIQTVEDINEIMDENKENIFNGPSDISLLKLSKQRIKQENEEILESKRRLMESERRRKLLLGLEKKEKELNMSRRNSIHKMKTLSLRKKENTILQETEFDRFNTESLQGDSNHTRAKEKHVNGLYDNTSKTNLSQVDTKIKEHNPADFVFEKVSANYAKLCQTVGELNLTEKENLECEMSIDRTASTMSVDSFDWEDEVYTNPFNDHPKDSIDVRPEPHQISFVNQASQVMKDETDDLAQTIKKYDVKLSDIQILKSMILAEEAAHQGRDAFKTIHHLDDLDVVKMSFSVDIPWEKGKPRLGHISRAARHSARLLRQAAILLTGRGLNRRTQRVYH